MSQACARAVRLVALRDLFDAGTAATARELATRLGVSQRSMQRDLTDLQAEPLRYPLVMDGWRYQRMRRDDVPDTR